MILRQSFVILYDKKDPIKRYLILAWVYPFCQLMFLMYCFKVLYVILMAANKYEINSKERGIFEREQSFKQAIWEIHSLKNNPLHMLIDTFRSMCQSTRL